MEHRKRRQFAFLPVLVAVLLVGVVYVALSDIVVPRGPRRIVDDPVRDPSVPGVVPEEGRNGEGAAGGNDETEPDDGAVEEEGFPPLDRESRWRLRGEVRDHEGKPVRAKVFVDHVRVGRIPLGFVTTDDEGHFRAFLPGPARYLVTAERDGTRISQTVGLEGDSVSAVAVLVFPGRAVIQGCVRTAFGPLVPDIRGTRPVPGEEPIALDLVPVAGGESLEALLDADGRYRISGAAPGEYFLRIRSKWFVTRVTLGAEEEQSFDIVLPAGRIHGRVTDAATGKPAEDVQVVLQWVGPGGALAGDHEKAGFATVSDRCAPNENGDYAFGNLPPGAYRMFSNGHWYNLVRGGATLSEGAMEARVDFPLEKGSVVNLKITDLEGREVPSPFCMTQGILWGFTGHVSGLKAGTVDFIAGGDGHEFQKQAITFRPGEVTPAGFKLAKQAATRLIFVDPGGKPVPGVRVAVPFGDHDIQRLSEAFRRGTNLPITVSDPAGAVWIYGVRAGPCAVRARKDGFAAFDDAVTLPEGGGEVTVTLTPGDVTFDFRLVVVRLAPDGPAAKLGVRPGDVIRAVNGKSVGSRKELAAAIDAAKTAGAGTVTVTVEQSGREVEIEFRTGTLGVSLEERFE